MKPISVRAPRGNSLTCKNWVIEAAYRMIQNNLDPEVAEKPSELVVYGGIGKAARNWDCFFAILDALKNLEPDETLLVQSGKPVAIFKTHTDAPKVLIANSNLVPKWATWEHFHELDRAGLMMYGQMTAGSWIYIGTQGILQGTYETFAACGKKYFEPKDLALPLLGKRVLSAGLGGMGGAQPLAAKLAGASFLGIDIDAQRLRRRIEEKYLDVEARNLDEALSLWNRYAENAQPYSIGLVGNASDILPELVKRGVVPDVVTDQTSAHDPLNGYVPGRMGYEEALELRSRDPNAYVAHAKKSMAIHVSAMLDMQSAGAVAFDYGNNIRAEAKLQGVERAFSIPGFVPEFIRPLFCEGNGPFRFVALSGSVEDIATCDRALLELFPENALLKNWLTHGAPQVKFQGLPARICWLRHGERLQAGLLLNELVRSGRVSAPIVIGRDHLDCGSVASPNRETEGMLDGSDAVSDWPILNALVNSVGGASWVSFHHGGGVGMGYSQHAGMVIVADGTPEAEQRLRRVLNSDPAMGVVRHADAGYPSATAWAREHGIRLPFIEWQNRNSSMSANPTQGS